jgi:hypothetical protein
MAIIAVSHDISRYASHIHCLLGCVIMEPTPLPQCPALSVRVADTFAEISGI